MKKLLLLSLLAILSGCSQELPPLAEHEGKVFCMRMATASGDMDLLIDAEKAPVSAQNFLDYANAGHYDNTIFHRVVKDFVIQGGGYTADLVIKETREPIANESGNGLSNVRGSLAMARTQPLHSATSQFYINLTDNLRLDQLKYAVFGKVVSGMEVVDAIATVKTGEQKRMRDVPEEAVTVHSVKRVQCPDVE